MENRKREITKERKKEIKYVFRHHRTKLALSIDEITENLKIHGLTSFNYGDAISNIKIVRTLNQLIRQKEIQLWNNINSEGKSKGIVFVLTRRGRRRK